ncbi:DUF3306 domain-containing protein [Telmatospirillum sp. J64-1]|uniref:DUF3306 domain-containing protein n=1 Tax=Telmatospirillum sp. J64-1 TaxID=2502183 RepID=UPI00115EBB7D|nr:DUF3306 domain-containing protein [Telmatospirillum sp. J64-1]
MSEQEGFVSRWSRLKRQAVQAEPEIRDPEIREAEPVPPSPPTEDAAACVPTVTEEEEVPPSLPPLDSLGADSDYRPFMAPNVPKALRLAALRTAWRSDPKIAGFKGFAEYDWDCNAPGYGKLLPVDDIARMCEKVFGQPEPQQPEEPEEHLLDDTEEVIAEAEEVTEEKHSPKEEDADYS